MKANGVFDMLALWGLVAICGAQNPGPFESNTDIGITPHMGKVDFAGAQEYRVADAEAFQFVWKKGSGNTEFTADVHFADTGALAHRKAALKIRQKLDTDAAYADGALDSDGLNSRATAGAETAQTQQTAKGDLSAPARIASSAAATDSPCRPEEPAGNLPGLVLPAWHCSIRFISEWQSALKTPTCSKQRSPLMSLWSHCRKRGRSNPVTAARFPFTISVISLPVRSTRLTRYLKRQTGLRTENI